MPGLTGNCMGGLRFEGMLAVIAACWLPASVVLETFLNLYMPALRQYPTDLTLMVFRLTVDNRSEKKGVTDGLRQPGGHLWRVLC